jgi:site-specific DNA-methyltransferase (cytosine-N4-specific)
LKQKDLVPIPWMVAMALQADGWYLRSDIIWHKPNPMPESVTDRPTKAHEYLFLLAKAERYYYDADAIAEPLSSATLDRDRYTRIVIGGKYEQAGPGNTTSDGVGRSTAGLVSHEQTRSPCGRNRRSVWTIPTLPYAGAHFATMPEALVQPCILAGSRLGDLVLDPFSGSGTVLDVAQRHGRRAVGCDLNPAYHVLAQARTAQRGFRFDQAVSAMADRGGLEQP